MNRIIVSLVLAFTLVTGLFAGGASESGSTVSKVYPARDFNSLEINSAFHYSVRQGTEYQVRIKAAEGDFNNIKVEQKGSDLVISYTFNNFFMFRSRARVEVEVVTPRLEQFKTSGATEGTILFNAGPEQEFNLEVQGASNLEANLIAGTLNVDVSGASKVTGRLALGSLKGEMSGASEWNTRMDAPLVDISVSGASSLRLKGTGKQFRAEISGASQVKAEDFPVETATIDASGASGVELLVSNSIDAEASGASSIQYRGTASLGRSRESGASSIRKRN